MSFLVRGNYDYSGEGGGLSFTEGQIFLVLNAPDDDDWWQAVLAAAFSVWFVILRFRKSKALKAGFLELTLRELVRFKVNLLCLF